MTALADAPSPSPPVPPPMGNVVILRAHKGFQAIHLKELWNYRDLLFTLAGRDIKVRYKQTVLGVAWVILQPLLAAGVFSFVFGTVAKLPHGDVPYIVFSFAGLLGWNLFTTTLSRSSGSLVGNAPLISKIYFPRMVIPLSMLPTALVDFAVAAGMMAVLMVINRITPTWGLLLLPLWVLLLLMLATGLGMGSAALAVRYRDVNYIIPVALQLLLYASPVAYSASAVPAKYQAIFYANPLSALLDAFRWSILGTGEPRWWGVGYAATWAVLSLLVGSMLFRKMEREFADVI